VVGKIGGMLPAHNGPMVLKVGVILGFTVIVLLIVFAHTAPFGVNVYVPVVVLLTVAGLQVPVIPLVEVVGKTGAAAPLHIAAIAAKVGVTVGFTVTDKVVVVAHNPGVGVNVYVPVVALLTVAGLQVPVIPLVEVVGKIGATVPLHIAAIAVNVGVTIGLIVTVIVFVEAQIPAVGVNMYVPEVVLFTVAGFQVPVIPLVEVVGKIGAVAPLQIVVIIVNVGVTIGFTVIDKVVVVIHVPLLGVNIYVPDVVLLTVAGLHVPVIPFVEVVGKTGGVAPLHIAAIAAKVAVVLGLTVTDNIVVLAHCPAFGVNV
jgi:hypothetical protein